jgi:4-hydroxythreonine-4-phosphate dehydrogenase
MSGIPIALTCGEPSGIGPEIAVAARSVLGDSIPFFLICDPAHLPISARVTIIAKPQDAMTVAADSLPVLLHSFAAPARPGDPHPDNARGVIEVIELAVGLVNSNQASAIVTNPISKKALKDGANFAFPGHTEFLAHLAGVRQVVMMLASDELRVVPTTIHIPLSEVPNALTRKLLEDTLRITHAALIRDFGIANPRIAVSGLNPHAGEGGVMGHEDASIIAPVIHGLSALGMHVTGPYPADTMFHSVARARYDCVVAMYHDQALIPIKTLAFDKGVNVTLGLPFVRTSPDHGTAFDIAGKGIADPSSLIHAIKLAAKMVAARHVTVSHGD